MKLKIFEQMKLPLSKVLFSRIKGYGCVNFLKNMIVVLLPVIWKDIENRNCVDKIINSRI